MDSITYITYYENYVIFNALANNLYIVQYDITISLLVKSYIHNRIIIHIILSITVT